MFAFSNIIRERLKPVYLFIYRFIAFWAIAGSFAFLIGWAWVMIFFMFSTTYIAPTVLSPTSDKMLQFAGAYQQAEQNLSTLIITRDQAVRDYQTSLDTYAHLQTLYGAAQVYLQALRHTAPLKLDEVRNQQALSQSLIDAERQARQNAKAGLLTNDTLVTTLSSIAQFRAIAMDGKTNWDTTNITAQSNMVQLETQLEQAKNDIMTKRETVAAATASVLTGQKSMDMLQNSVYKHAFDRDGANLMFVKYDNLHHAQIGSPIYDCYLMIVACYQVGTITQIYSDEQMAEFPIFNVKLSKLERGVFAQAKMTHVSSMRSALLFVGGKPLFF